MGIPIRRMRPAKFGLPGQQRSKYGAVGVRVDGRFFHSKREARRYQQLKVLEMIGEIRNLECQVRLPLFVNGMKVTTYVCDFRYITKDGRTILLDVKGMETEVFKLKKKLVQACLGIDIVVEK